MAAKPYMGDPEARECRCESCDRPQWVNGPLVPTVGLVCDICRDLHCPACGGEMRPVHSYLRRAFEQGATNKLTPQERQRIEEATRA